MTLLLLACSWTGKPTFDTAVDADTSAGPPAATVRPGDVLVSEVMFDPAMVDGDLGEWFEVRNLGGAAIDLAGVVIQDDDGSGFVVEGPLPVEAGGFAVFGPSAESGVNGGAPVDYTYSIDAVKLGNEGDALTLFANGDPLDVFTWDATVFTVAEGSALQLSSDVADPDANDTASAWCLATTPYGAGDLGTPDAANAPCG